MCGCMCSCFILPNRFGKHGSTAWGHLAHLHYRSRGFNLALVLALSLPGVTSAQVPIVKLAGGGVADGKLPFGRPYNVTGSALVGADTALAVSVTIRCAPADTSCRDAFEFVSERRRPTTIESRYWWREGAEAQAREFSLPFGRRLLYGKDYEIRVERYVRYGVASGFTNRVIDRVFEAARAEYDRTRGVSTISLVNALPAALSTTMREDKLAGRVPANAGFLIRASDGKPILGKSPRLSPDAVSAIADNLFIVVGLAVVAEDGVDAGIQAVASTRQTILDFAASTRASSLVAALDGAVESNLLNPGDVAPLKAFLSDPQPGVDPIGRAFELILDGDVDVPRVDATHRASLAHVSVLHEDLVGRSAELEDARAALAAATTERARYRIDLGDAIVTASAGHGQATTSRVGTELQSLLVGTTAGAGGVFLGEGEWDMFTYAALKFYLGPVDKSLPEPYLGDHPALNRLAFSFGILAGDGISFRGSDLEDVVGVKPLLALSFDVTPFVTVDGGFIFFRQPLRGPATTDKQLRGRPFFGVSFDFNIIDRLRGNSDNSNGQERGTGREANGGSEDTDDTEKSDPGGCQ